MISTFVSRAQLCASAGCTFLGCAILCGVLVLIPPAAVGAGQTSGGMTQKQISYNSQVYLFRVLTSGTGQISTGGQVVGTILSDGKGGERVVGVAGAAPSQDVLVVYGMYKAGNPSPAGAQTAGAAGAAGGKPQVLGTEGVTPTFDSGTNTATFPDGTTVVFVDKDHAKLHWPTGPATAEDFDLVYHGGSAGGFMKGVAGSNRGVMGSSLGGSGVKFMLAATANNREVEMFDTGEGTTIYTAKVEKFKPMIHAVLQAADTAAAAGHSVNDWQVVKSIRSNNLGIK
jgi:hypothetical protein